MRITEKLLRDEIRWVRNSTHVPLVLSCAYGGYLIQLEAEGGGVRDLQSKRGTAREAWIYLDGWAMGFAMGVESHQKVVEARKREAMAKAKAAKEVHDA